MLKPEVKAKWLEDLRSGNIQQGVSHLRDSRNRFCCLGVLARQFADTWMRESGRQGPIRAGQLLANGTIGDMGGHLSNAFMEEIGLLADEARELARMNDTRSNFAAIADKIERSTTI